MPPMARRVAVVVGVGVAVAGFVAALAALALPWAHYSIRAEPGAASAIVFAGTGSLSLFNLGRGGWYLGLLLATGAAVVAAGTTGGWPRRLGGVAGVLLGLAGTLLAVAMVDEITAGAVRTSIEGLVDVDATVGVGPAVGPAILAPFLLAVASAVFAASRQVLQPGTGVEDDHRVVGADRAGGDEPA